MNASLNAIINEARAPRKKRINKLARAAISNNLIRHGFSQDEIAKYLGIKQSAICRLISNADEYDTETRYKMFNSEIHTNISEVITQLNDFTLKIGA